MGMFMNTKGRIYGINGPVIYIKGPTKFRMNEMVYVGSEKLVGEVITLDKSRTTIQVFEETAGLSPGEEVVGTGTSMSLTLGPGILNNIFDGIERPLRDIAEKSGAFIDRGVSVESLDFGKLWNTHITVKPGDEVNPGTIIANVPETKAIVHKVMVPPGVKGVVDTVKPDGDYHIDDVIVTISLENGGKKDLTMVQKWPIRTPRPVIERHFTDRPLVTGQRILDSMFPIAKGGTVAIPGGFGTGKTMTQHQIAKWSDADIIIYIGCGERGNEMTQVLEDFKELVDPKSGNPLMDRTVLIANTSNMPVAAREASIYTGVTLAEYYRDMGYDVAIMADSTSRWAEALRELSGRLEEMPAEEGFPAYLASKLSAFYERAGRVENLNHTEGSVTIIGAVSPQGGDFSEPVTQNTKRFVRAFMGLDKSLAYARHFPAINWLISYSEYITDMTSWYAKNVDKDFMNNRNTLLAILNKESSLMEIVKLIGSDVLPEDQKLTLEIARVIRVGFLQQNAFHKDDTCVPLEKQNLMMETILYLDKRSKELVSKGMPVSVLRETGIFDKIIAIKYDVPNDKPEMFADYRKAIDNYVLAVLEKNA
jgi:ATP synthase alpha/beta chain, C terminal domain